jgi:hypothetical protein
MCLVLNYISESMIVFWEMFINKLIMKTKNKYVSEHLGRAVKANI